MFDGLSFEVVPAGTPIFENPAGTPRLLGTVTDADAIRCPEAIFCTRPWLDAFKAKLDAHLEANP